MRVKGMKSEENTKNKGGCPTKYREEYCAQMIEYFDVTPYEIVTDADGNKDAIVGVFPTLARFALNIGVHRDTINEWANKHDEFSVAKKIAKEYHTL